MNDTQELSENEKLRKDLYIINLYRETISSFQYNTNMLINGIGLERKQSVIISVAQLIHPYLKLKYNYSASDIDKYIIDEYPTFLTTNYFNNMIVNFINTSKYDSRNDKSIKKLFSSITDNIFNQLDSGEIKPITESIFNIINNYKDVDNKYYDTVVIDLLIDNPNYNKQLSELISISYVFYRKLNSEFNNKTLNLDRYPTYIYNQIEYYLDSLNEFDVDYFNDFISGDIYFLLDLVVKRLKEYDYNNNLPVIF